MVVAGSAVLWITVGVNTYTIAVRQARKTSTHPVNTLLAFTTSIEAFSAVFFVCIGINTRQATVGHIMIQVNTLSTAVRVPLHACTLAGYAFRVKPTPVAALSAVVVIVPAVNALSPAPAQIFRTIGIIVTGRQ